MNEVLLSVSHSVVILAFVSHADCFVGSDFDEIDFEFLVFIPSLLVQLLAFEPLLLVSIR